MPSKGHRLPSSPWALGEYVGYLRVSKLDETCLVTYVCHESKSFSVDLSESFLRVKYSKAKPNKMRKYAHHTSLLCEVVYSWS